MLECQSLSQLLRMYVGGSEGTEVALALCRSLLSCHSCSLLVSALLTPVQTTRRQLLRSAAAASHKSGLISADFMSLLYTSLWHSIGRPTGLESDASSPYWTSLGRRPSSMSRTWPSQRRRLWDQRRRVRPLEDIRVGYSVLAECTQDASQAT